MGHPAAPFYSQGHNLSGGGNLASHAREVLHGHHLQGGAASREGVHTLSGIGRMAMQHDPVRPGSSSPPLQGTVPRSGSSAARRGNMRQSSNSVKRGGVMRESNGVMRESNGGTMRASDGFKTGESLNNQQIYEAPQQAAHGAAADIAWGSWPHTPRDFGRSPVLAAKTAPDVGSPPLQPGSYGPGLRFCETWREGEQQVRASDSPAEQAELLSSGTVADQAARPVRKRSPVLPHVQASTPSVEEEPRDQMVPWGDEDGRQARAGLGSIQPEGRAQVLQQWCHGPDERLNSAGQQQAATGKRASMTQVQKKKQDSKAQQQLFRQNLSQMTDAPGATLCVNQSYIKGLGTEGQKLEWSTLSSKSKHALWQWVVGQLGGRHCLMILEHDVAIDFFISPLDSDEVVMSDLKGGVVLNALSGLQADTSAAGSASNEGVKGNDGGWLYQAVFGKSPARVLEDAFEAALADATETWLERPSGLSVQQVNLSLKRQAMRAQSLGMQAMANSQANKGVGGPRSSEEYMRVQIWLELLRLHVEGALGSAPPPAPPQMMELECTEASMSSGGKGGKEGPRPVVQYWDDTSVLHELGKGEADREAESKKMTLDSLRVQNRSIEAYLMRLVRQRDKLKNIARLAEECDSYIILGLEGPDATENEVKKAYRTLARKEHPDKAGTDNKGRFQEIQQAYAAVVRQRRGSSDGDMWSGNGGRRGSDSSEVPEPGSSSMGAIASEAVSHAETARDSADRATSCAYQSFQLGSLAAQTRAQPKRGALRELRDLAVQAVAQLRGAAVYLRSVKESACGVARCAKDALEKYGEFADLAIAGAGLNERASLVHESGQASLSAAEHLDKTSEVSELILQQVARNSNERSGASDSVALQSMRLLGDSLSRGAAVARCAADEAISTATKALELSCSLVALDREWQREHEQAERNKAPDSPTVATDPRVDGEGGKDGDDADGENKDPAKKDEQKEEEEKERCKKEELKKEREKEELKKEKEESKHLSDIERIKKQHINLRVKNLQCLGSLNEEVLQLQGQLRGLFKRSEGGLLPAISLAQKDGVFELVKQLLNSAFVEASKLASDVTVSVKTALEKPFAFALALEHTKEVALSAEVRTHVLKLAALVDLDLLCQIIDGPFRSRLLGLDAARRPVAAATFSSSFPSRNSIRPSARPGVRGSTGRCSEANLRSTGDSFASWGDGVDTFCERLLRCFKVLESHNRESSKPVVP